MAKQMTKVGRMTGRVYLFPQQIKELDAEWEQWYAATHGTPPPAADAAVTLPAKKSAPGANIPVDPVRAARFAEAVAFIRDYTGTFGLILDLRANPAFGTKHYRLSDRQIEVVLASKQRDIDFAARRKAQAAPVAQGKPADEGWYKKGDDFFKVQIAIHGSRRPYAKRLVVLGDKAEWQYAPGVVNTLTEADRLTEEDARAFGQLYGICAVCGIPLTNEESIEYGIGPICRGKAFGA